MLPFMEKALLIWGEPAPRREARPHWLTAAKRGRPLARGWLLICIRSDCARVTLRLKHAGRLLKRQARRAARTGRAGRRRVPAECSRGVRRYPARLSGGWAAEAGLRHLLFQPSLPLLLPAPGTRVLVGDTPRERDPLPCRLQDIVAPLLGPPLSGATRCCSRQPSTVPTPCR